MNLLFQVVLGLTLNSQRRKEALKIILPPVQNNVNNAGWFLSFYWQFQDKACKGTGNCKIKCALNLNNFKLKAEPIVERQKREK